MVRRPSLSVVMAQSSTANRLTHLGSQHYSVERSGVIYDKIKEPKNGSSRPAREKKSVLVSECRQNSSSPPSTHKSNKC
jgi:hypothetical protein